MAIILREFIYYDREKIEDFLSGIEDGLVKEEIETRREHGAKYKAEGGVKPFINVGGEKGYTDNELQKLKTSTDASLFQKLHVLLNQDNMMNSFESIDQKGWDQINTGDILEIEADIEFSGLSVLLNKIFKLMTFMEQVGLDVDNDPKTREAIAGFNMIDKLSSEEGLNIKVTPVNSPEYKFVAVVPNENNIKGNKKELIGRYKVMCRVQKILNEGESIELFKLIPGIEMDKGMIKEFLMNFEDMPPMLGEPLKLEDMQINSPAMTVTPIAIYR
jgi:hypothetical protein